MKPNNLKIDIHQQVPMQSLQPGTLSDTELLCHLLWQGQNVPQNRQHADNLLQRFGGLRGLQIACRLPTKEREGINPFTGEKAIFKAKPARKVVKVSALKGLKDMV